MHENKNVQVYGFDIDGEKDGGSVATIEHKPSLSSARMSGLSVDRRDRQVETLVGKPSSHPDAIQSIAKHHITGRTNVASLFNGKSAKSNARLALITLDALAFCDVNDAFTRSLVTGAMRNMIDTRSQANILAFSPDASTRMHVGIWDETKNQCATPLLGIESPSSFIEAIAAKTFTTQPWALGVYDASGRLIAAVYVLGKKLYYDKVENLEESIKRVLQSHSTSCVRIPVAFDRNIPIWQEENIPSALLVKEFDHLVRQPTKVVRTNDGRQLLFVTDVLGNTWPLNLAPCESDRVAELIGPAFQVKQGIGDPIGLVDDGVQASEQPLMAFFRRTTLTQTEATVEVRFYPLAETLEVIGKNEEVRNFFRAYYGAPYAPKYATVAAR